jgi:hypothetical protein
MAFVLSQHVAYADVYYNTPSTIYVRPDPSYQAGQAIGSILGALIQGANEKAAQQNREKAELEYQETKRKIQQYFDTTTRQDEVAEKFRHAQPIS